MCQEKVNGKGLVAKRPEWEHCLKVFRLGDGLVVWRLNRLGRSLSELVRIVGELEERGVGLVSLKENIETGNAARKLMFHVFASLACRRSGGRQPLWCIVDDDFQACGRGRSEPLD